MILKSFHVLALLSVFACTHGTKEQYNKSNNPFDFQLPDLGPPVKPKNLSPDEEIATYEISIPELEPFSKTRDLRFKIWGDFGNSETIYYIPSKETFYYKDDQRPAIKKRISEKKWNVFVSCLKTLGIYDWRKFERESDLEDGGSYWSLATCEKKECAFAYGINRMPDGWLEIWLKALELAGHTEEVEETKKHVQEMGINLKCR